MKILFVLVQVILAISFTFTGNVEKNLQDGLIYIAEADYSNQNNTVVLIQSPINLEFTEFAAELAEEQKWNQKKFKIYVALLDTFVPNNPVPY